jgi:hypothetical protein
MSFDLPESGFVEPVYRNDQVCEVRYTATDAGGFLCLKWWFGGSDRCDWEGLEQCACDKDINSFDCPQGNDGPLTMDVSGEAIYSPGFQGQCIDVNINDPVTPSRKVYQEALTIGSCGAPEGPIEDPNDNEETESASQPVVTAQATDSRIQMSLQAISVSGGKTSLEYSAELLTDVEGGVVLMLELYRADENGEYAELIEDKIPLGDINNQGGSSEETWPILIDTPTPPAVAKLRAYNAGGEQLLSEYLYGFGVEVVHPES